MMDLSFYNGKKVLVTGHTGFKGSWLCQLLAKAGAKVIGYALQPPTDPNLFSLANIEKKIVSLVGDIRDFDKLKSVFETYKPEIVIHLAAQPIVRDSYKFPRYTFETNVMGTVNLLECSRLTDSVKSVLNVTTDKVYLNKDDALHAFKEDEPLDGFDPYSNSKSCSELVTHSYIKSFFCARNCSISTARAGNVIGGGDFANERIIPDCVRAIESNSTILVRNPFSTRPYQHVLEPLYVYLEICEKQYGNEKFQGSFNVGPDECDCVTTGELVTLFCQKFGNGISWTSKNDNGPHEASYLRLDNSKLKKTFNWKPKWHIEKAVDMVCQWTKVYLKNKNEIPDEMDREISEFLSGD